MSFDSTRTTRHTCGGPVFGKKTAGCPRCDELLAGAQPVQWRESRRQEDARRAAEWREHAASHRHTSGGCGPVGRERRVVRPMATTTALIDRAYRLGSRDAYAGRPMLDLDSDDSATLMTELGETEPTTAANAPRRSRLCDAYEDGYYAAAGALR